jgi:hypothetical protein
MVIGEYLISTGQFLSKWVLDKNLGAFNNNNSRDSVFWLNQVIKTLSLKDECRCRIHWRTLGQFSGKYVKYEEFRAQWDTNINLKDAFKEEYEEKKRKLKLFKATLAWFLDPKNRK